MNTMISSSPAVSSGFKVDISRGERIGRVSSEWFSRPDDERYLSLSDLHRAVSERTERARVRTVESADIRVEATRDNAERLSPSPWKRESPAANVPSIKRGARQGGVCWFDSGCEVSGLVFGNWYLGTSVGV